jgi:hypothetical protein
MMSLFSAGLHLLLFCRFAARETALIVSVFADWTPE